MVGEVVLPPRVQSGECADATLAERRERVAHVLHARCLDMAFDEAVAFKLAKLVDEDFRRDPDERAVERVEPHRSIAERPQDKGLPLLAQQHHGDLQRVSIRSGRWHGNPLRQGTAARSRTIQLMPTRSASVRCRKRKCTILAGVILASF